MSNHLAFGTVTAALRNLLERPAKKEVSAATATVERPDLLKTDEPRVNIFLYGVTPNTDWRNEDLPTRRPDGSLARRPQAAFNLHYVLTFYGKESDYEPQRILGSVVSVLHAQPVLSREIVRSVTKDLFAGSDLVDQVDLVRLTPLTLSLEELSKLWSVFFQVPYKLSLAYQASVVLVEPEISTQPALPVRARNLYVVPLERPEVDEVVSAADPGQPIVLGSTIVLRGRRLRGEVTRVRIGNAEVEPQPEDVRGDEVRLLLDVPPFAAGALRPGVLGAQIVHPRWMGTPPQLHTGTESNVAPFVLHPRIQNIDISLPAPDPPKKGFRTVTVGIEPAVGRSQRVVLFLNEPVPTAPRAFSAVALRRDGDADPVQFELSGLDAGLELLARVQVDGAESPLEVTNGAYSGPRVQVP